MENMRDTTNKAFKDADRAARLLGDMKTGIYEVKIHGGIGEKEKLEALMGFRDQAEDILKNMADSIGSAIYAIDEEAARLSNPDACECAAQLDPKDCQHMTTYVRGANQHCSDCGVLL